MKKRKVFIMASICALVLAGCGTEAQSPAGGDYKNGGNTGPGDGGIESAYGTGGGELGDEWDSAASMGNMSEVDIQQEEEAITLRFRIVDGAESGSLVLAGEGEGSVYTLSVQSGEVPIELDGQPADASVLEDGMIIDVRFAYIMETFPGQMGQIYGISAYSLGTELNPGGGCYDLCGLYLQVLSDLWDRDAGLNDGISYVSVDLSNAPGGLTEGEKTAVAWVFAGWHNAECLTLNYAELEEQGYLTEMDGAGGSGLYQWEDGILFTITAEDEENGISSLNQLKFNAKKWRSPVGAYYFMDCTAVWPQMGTWDSYQIGGEAIS